MVASEASWEDLQPRLVLENIRYHPEQAIQDISDSSSQFPQEFISDVS